MIVGCMNFGTRCLLPFCPRGQTRPPHHQQQQKLKTQLKKPTKQYVLFISHQNMQNIMGENSAKTKKLNSNILLKN